MKNIFYIIFISFFSLTLISCASSSDDGASKTTTTSSDNDTTTTTDTTAPVIAEETPVTTPTNDNTPDFSFSSTEAGTITYYGGCYSSTTSATTGTNTVTFNTLSDGIYSACYILVTDSAGNVSNTLEITSFTIDTSPGVFVAVGYSGTILRSTDNGSSFDNVTHGGGSNLLEAVTFGNNTFVAVGYDGTIVR